MKDASRKHLGGIVRLAVLLALAAWILPGGSPSCAENLPPGFVAQAIPGDWEQIVGLAFGPLGRLYVWEKAGRVWIVGDEGQLASPLVDIREEVGNWRDHGMLGFAVDPDFASNGFVYLFYVVDHHHLTAFGTPDYDPELNEYYKATIGRITRYTARMETNLETVDPTSRLILVGQTIDSGFPVLHESHGVGSLIFGADGTLLASAGDGANYRDVDTGGEEGGSNAEQALAEAIIAPKEDVGSFRAQLVDSLAGKIVRIDPATGDGVPSNPFFDPEHPRSARSRVWVLGLRNPFRVALGPGTGSVDPLDGDPGTLYIGDVGLRTWEELDVAAGPGLNFGWPAFEGMDPLSDFQDAPTANLDAPNDLFGDGCAQEFFDFQDLIRQDTLDTEPSFPNPCDPAAQIPEAVETFLHARPLIDWGHGPGPTRTAIFVGNEAASIEVGAAGSPVAGPQFGGIASVAGAWYTGDDFPPDYGNTYFHADWGYRWVRNFVFDVNDRLLEIRNFLSSDYLVAGVATHPTRGGLYYIRYPSELARISFVGNEPPGVSDGTDGNPMRVGKLDPGGVTLSLDWDSESCLGIGDHQVIFGGGSELPSPTRETFEVGGSRCAVGPSSPFVWEDSPDPTAEPSGLIWWVLVATDGATAEGSWGKRSGGGEREGPGEHGSSGECGVTTKLLSNVCGQ